MDNRREFLKKAGAAAIGAAVVPGVVHGQAGAGGIPGDGPGKDLLMAALQAARDGGASYADARLGRYRSQSVATRERQVTKVSEAESFGIGIRALVNGSWGFAATRDLTQAAVQAAARDAARIARAAAPFQKRPVVLAPVAPVVATWQTPIERDPLDVPLEEKVSLLLAANEAALIVKGLRFVTSSLSLLREDKTLATTDGTLTAQTFYRVSPEFTATAIAPDDEK